MNNPHNKFSNIKVPKQRCTYPCLDCGIEYAVYFMLRREIWLSIAKQEDVLFIDCTSKRLGRQLSIEDFNTSVINYPIFYAYGNLK